MITIFLCALAIAITAFVYSYILVQPGEILSGWMRFLDKLFRNDQRYLEDKGMHPIFKLMIGCTKCVSGQMALWFFLWKYWSYYRNLELGILPYHIMAIAITIFFANLIKIVHEKYTNS